MFVLEDKKIIKMKVPKKSIACSNVFKTLKSAKNALNLIIEEEKTFKKWKDYEIARLIKIEGKNKIMTNFIAEIMGY